MEAGGGHVHARLDGVAGVGCKGVTRRSADRRIARWVDQLDARVLRERIDAPGWTCCRRSCHRGVRPLIRVADVEALT